MAKKDLLFSEDGDIVLGGAKTDDDGNLLYIYSDGTVTNESMKGGEEGRLVRDFVYTSGRNAYKQIILNRLKTDAPDWFHYPNMGGNLTDLIGEPNTRETGERGVAYIIDALSYAGLFNPVDLEVRAVPINPEEILFRITINTRGIESYRLPLILNLNHGLREV